AWSGSAEGGGDAMQQMRRARGPCDRREGDLSVERRLAKAPRAPFGLDDVADVLLGTMNPLPARCAHERVVMQRRDDGNAAGARDRRQVERQIQQVVNM